MTLGEALDTYTVDLVLDGDRAPIPRRRASGVILKKGSDLVVLTAGHILSAGERWFLERRATACIPAILVPLNGLTSVLAVQYGDQPSVDDLDVAWATLDLDRISKTLGASGLQKPRIDLPVYQGPTNLAPDTSTTYAFVAHNRGFFDKNRSELVRDRAFEFGMRYDGRSARNRLYRFKLAEEHQGHDYYRGASGAPIADETGTIVSILVSGCPEDNAVYGFPIAEYSGMIGL
jgi:hypothetical protein